MEWSKETLFPAPREPGQRRSGWVGNPDVGVSSGVLTGEDGEELLQIKVWRAGHKGTRWTHLVLTPTGEIVATATGSVDKSAWERVSDALRRRASDS